MNKLTERILARYVETGVKCKYSDDKQIYTYDFTATEIDYIDNKLPTYHLMDLGGGHCAKLILRPLSDLTKPCLEGGKVPLIELAKLAIKGGKVKYKIKKSTFGDYVQATGNYVYMFLPSIENGYFRLKIKSSHTEDYTECGINQFQLFEQLHLWHFDTGLDKDLWIDVNALEVV